MRTRPIDRTGRPRPAQPARPAQRVGRLVRPPRLGAGGAAMRKNWLAAAWTRRFRAEPLVPDAAFQGATEPYPGHWRRFPEHWPAAPAGRPRAQALTSGLQAALDAALA